VKLLLDTHILLWARIEPARLSPEVRHALEDSNNQKIISVVSLTEIAIKASIGKIAVDPAFFDTIDTLGCDVEPFLAQHAKALAALPSLHRDPFDRMLIVQAMIDGATLVTVDERILAYDVPTLT